MKDFKVGDKVLIETVSTWSDKPFNIRHGTVLTITKNNLVKVYCVEEHYILKFRQNGEMCGTTWKDATYTMIEKIC